MEKKTNNPKTDQENTITRKEAIHKVGKYAAFTAASMMLLMSPTSSSAAQPSLNQQNPHKPKKH